MPSLEAPAQQHSQKMTQGEDHEPHPSFSLMPGQSCHCELIQEFLRFKGGKKVKQREAVRGGKREEKER